MYKYMWTKRQKPKRDRDRAREGERKRELRVHSAFIGIIDDLMLTDDCQLGI